jgi:hypothetical protein
MNPCNYLLWGHLKDHVYHTNPPTTQELQLELEAVAEEITGDMLHDTADNLVVHLHETEASHIQHVFT